MSGPRDMMRPFPPSLAQRVCGLAEGVCLAGIAGAILALSTGGTLWYYINPRYQPLVVAAAFGMIGLGTFAALVPPRPARPSRPIVFALLLLMCWLGRPGESLTPKPGQGVLGEPPAVADRLDSGLMPDGTAKPALPSRATLDGREYIRINLGELFDICAAKSTDKLGLGYLVQGYVRRQGDVALIVRTAMYCCLADATEVAFRLKADPKTLPSNGAWVQVYGQLEKAPAGPPPKVDLGGFASINPDYVFKATKIEEKEAPKPPFMFEWRDKEPYAF